MPSADCGRLTGSLKRASAALRDSGIPHALSGGLAAWAYGAPESEHDVDLVVLPEDAQRAQRVLADIGMRPVDPPEGWLLKVYDGDVLVDLIFAPNGVPVSKQTLDRAQQREVDAVSMPVLPIEEVIASKLLALNERSCDFERVLAIARAVREQVDWRLVRARTDGSAFAAAFFTLVVELGIVDAAAARDVPAHV
jgi:predicted nucleotidyltransferase